MKVSAITLLTVLIHQTCFVLEKQSPLFLHFIEAHVIVFVLDPLDSAYLPICGLYVWLQLMQSANTALYHQCNPSAIQLDLFMRSG